MDPVRKRGGLRGSGRNIHPNPSKANLGFSLTVLSMVRSSTRVLKGRSIIGVDSAENGCVDPWDEC